MFTPSALLALLVALPTSSAKVISISAGTDTNDSSLKNNCCYITVLTPPNTIGSVAADVESGVGAESVDLVESDAWLHGSAAVKALPRSSATLTLTLYDTASAALAVYAGTLGADGTVKLSPYVSAECTIKGICDAVSDPNAVDLEVRAAQIFASSAGGYELALDLGGADTYSVAYADLVVSEDGGSATKAEIGWDEIGAVWTAQLGLVHAGQIQAKAKAYDLNGKAVETTKVKVGVPWVDGGSGASTLATDDDPYTSVAVLPTGGDALALVVVADGWTLGSELPVTASVALDGGETLAVPANSYQVGASVPITFSGSPEAEAFQLMIDGQVVKEGAGFTERGICSNGTCVALDVDADGAWTLLATAYGTDAAKLPTSVKVTLTSTLKAAQTDEESYVLIYSDEVAVVFAQEVSAAADPIGVDLSGKVSLLGAPSKKGKQSTLAKGKFYGTFDRDWDGDLSIGGADKDVIQAKGDILIGGEPIDFELVDADKDGVISAPPVVVLRVESNGKGTTNTMSTTSQTQPQLL